MVSPIPRRPLPTLVVSHYPLPAGPRSAGYGAGGAALHLVEDEGYECARRVRNVIAHLRRGGAAYKPLVIVRANSGVPEEVSAGGFMIVNERDVVGRYHTPDN